MTDSIAALGGTGRLGRLIVRRLIERGERVRVVGRDPLRARAQLDPRAQLVPGDVRDPDSLAEPLRECSAIVFAVDTGFADSGPDSPQATMYEGILNTLKVGAAASRQPHVVAISQICVTRRDHPMNAYGKVLDWRLAGEDAVRASGLPYTIVRPGWFADAAGTEGADLGVRLAQGDARDGTVRRTDVAEAVAQAIGNPASHGVTFEIFNEPGSAPSRWTELFAALTPDD